MDSLLSLVFICAITPCLLRPLAPLASWLFSILYESK